MDPSHIISRTDPDVASPCAFHARLSALHDGELDAETAATVQKHVAGCDACRVELDEIRELSSITGEVGTEGMSLKAIRRVHLALDAENMGFSFLRIAGVLSGLAASGLVIGSVWLSEVPRSGVASQPVMIVDSGPAWESVAVNLKVDPLPKTSWEVNDQQMLADARMVEWMLDGLSGKAQ